MKIAFIYDTAYPWNTGGAERRIYEIAKRLAKDHDVHIYSLGYWMESSEYKNQKEITYENITYHSVGKPRDLYTIDNKRSISEALYFALCILRTNISGFDIIDCQGFPYFSCFSSWFHTLFRKTKLVITLHEIWNDYWYEYMGRIGLFGKIIERLILYLTDNYICVSKLTQDNMLENHDPKNKIIIANGVNTKDIDKVAPSDEYYDVIYAGRLIPEKHVDLIVNAMAKVVKKYPDTKCLIIGEGPTLNKLKSLSDKLGLNDNIIFNNFYEKQEDLYSHLKNSGVFILPSTREGFGIVVIEANYSKIPVITIDSPFNAAKDLIYPSNGWVINDDVDELSDLLIKLQKDPVSKKMKDECKLMASKYDWDNIAKQTEIYYKQILKEEPVTVRAACNRC